MASRVAKLAAMALAAGLVAGGCGRDDRTTTRREPPTATSVPSTPSSTTATAPPTVPSTSTTSTTTAPTTPAVSALQARLSELGYWTGEADGLGVLRRFAMSPDVWALTTAVLAWHHAGWMWLWGGLMLVVWAAIIGTLFWMVVLPTDPRRRPPPVEQGTAGRRDGDRVHA